MFKHSHDTPVPQNGAGVPRWGADFPRRFLLGGSVLLLSLLAFVGVSPASAAGGQVGQITQFPVARGHNPEELVRGSDGNLWFATPPNAMPAFPATFGRITPTGQITQFADPIANAGGGGSLTLGPDGNVWFFDRIGFDNEQIGRITPKGQIREFLIPSPDGSRVIGSQITVGSDGNLWFTASTFAQESTGTGFIGRVTAAGVITEFVTPTIQSEPIAIALGSDGNIFFSEFAAFAIGRITPTGQITEFPLPNHGIPGGSMVRGSDGNLWFNTLPGLALNTPATIGRITPAGQIREFLVPAFKGNKQIMVNGLTVGSDGNLWFTATTFTGTGNPAVGFIGRVTTAGVITEFGTPTALSNPGAITSGSDGNVWFAEFAAQAIGRVTTH